MARKAAVNGVGVGARHWYFVYSVDRTGRLQITHAVVNKKTKKT